MWWLFLSLIQRDLLLKETRYKQVQDSHPSVDYWTEVKLATYTAIKCEFIGASNSTATSLKIQTLVIFTFKRYPPTAMVRQWCNSCMNVLHVLDELRSTVHWKTLKSYKIGLVIDVTKKNIEKVPWTSRSAVILIPSLFLGSPQINPSRIHSCFDTLTKTTEYNTASRAKWFVTRKVHLPCLFADVQRKIGG